MTCGSGIYDEEVLRNNEGDMKAANKDCHVRGTAGGSVYGSTLIKRVMAHTSNRSCRVRSSSACIACCGGWLCRFDKASGGATGRGVCLLGYLEACALVDMMAMAWSADID
jgi:hypothetical protein